MKPIYLDYNATTPMAKEVITAMIPFFNDLFGNPSSKHAYGLEAKKAIENARKKVACLLHAHQDEIIFTSGGTEANNLAIKGIAFSMKGRGNHIITSSIEHPAVMEVCRFLETQGFQITYLPVDVMGKVNPSEVEKSIRPETILISIMHANNEVGTIQPITKIAEIAHQRNILMHTDAAQSIGKIPVKISELKVDLLSVAGHKLYAPKGIGALYIRRGVHLEKQIHGADHETNLRAGTENVMQIVGLGVAADLCAEYDTLDLKILRDQLYHGILAEIPNVRLNGHPDDRLPNTLSIGFPGVDASILLNEMVNIAASAGAACHSEDEKVSGVLSAMRVNPEYALGTIRFSLGRMTTDEEIKQAVSAIVEAYHRLRGNEQNGKIGQSGSVKLTEYSHTLGCACKISPQHLKKILSDLPSYPDANVLVDHLTSDDAAVYRINDESALVETVDVIPPVVDDPYTYGAIAAANALSDIYAMGAEPIFALSILAFPEKRLPTEILRRILKGGEDKAAEAGIRIIGGHSLEDPGLKFGMVITGKVHPEKILRNSTAKPGDALILTKPLGTGILTTAMKRGLADPEHIHAAIASMIELNRVAARVMRSYPVNACTDVTGFGLLGHLKEILDGARLSAVIDASKIPVLNGSWENAAAGTIPGGTWNNLEFTKPITHWESSVPETLRLILADAQTSGGLLITLPLDQADAMLDELQGCGCIHARQIGLIIEGKTEIFVR